MSENKTIQPFQVNRIQEGEYRIYLDLTNLGDKAFEVLQLAATLGFDKPEFVTDTTHTGGLHGHVFAVLLREFHSSENDPGALYDHLEEQKYELWEACEPEAELKFHVSYRFKRCLEEVAA